MDFFLHRYLQEVGYSDTILDIRSQRVRSLLSNYNENKVLDENVLLNGANLPKVILKRYLFIYLFVIFIIIIINGIFLEIFKNPQKII